VRHNESGLQVLDKTLYVSLDYIWFSNNTLVNLADDFFVKVVSIFFLDEVQYDNWSQELKNIYDDYPMLKVTCLQALLVANIECQS
jgi:predicted AAA+ superfamily ATPase